MNPINLLLPDGTPSKVWACGECKMTCRDQHSAETCCTPIPCKFCGEPTDKLFRYSFDTAEHKLCEMADRRKRDDERMARAEKLEAWDGWVYDWGGGGSNDGYHESVEAFVEHLEENDDLEPEDWPDWVYIAESRPGCVLDISDILENACSDGHEDMDEHLNGVKELEAAIEVFNTANEGVLVYEADCKRAVRVPKPTAPSPTEAHDAHWPRPDDRVKDSPVGPGLITEWTDAGFPRINGAAVAWCVLEDGRVFDPRGVMESQRSDRA